LGHGVNALRYAAHRALIGPPWQFQRDKTLLRRDQLAEGAARGVTPMQDKVV